MREIIVEGISEIHILISFKQKPAFHIELCSCGDVTHYNQFDHKSKNRFQTIPFEPCSLLNLNVKMKINVYSMRSV